MSDHSKLAEAAIRQGICNRVNRNGKSEVLPGQLIGAFYEQEIKHHAEVVAELLADFERQVRLETLEEAAQHWPIGELGILTDFRCSCGATLVSEPDSASRIAVWKIHIQALRSGAESGASKGKEG